jgi:hypothetical protein
VRARRELLVSEGFDANALESEARETPEAAAVIARFLQLVSARELELGAAASPVVRSAPAR